MAKIHLGQMDFFELGNLDSMRDWGHAKVKKDELKLVPRQLRTVKDLFHFNDMEAVCAVLKKNIYIRRFLSFFVLKKPSSEFCAGLR